MNYFSLTQSRRPVEELDTWLRRRLRCIVWRQWKRRENAGVETARTWALGPTRMEIQRQRAGPLVERRGQAYDRSLAAEILHATRAGLAGDCPPASPASCLNRRMRNRTYGGVRGLRG
ncbi:group II intron maturase-specific domain-containing protein [Rhodoferax sediminis]|uniref:group II intron maturase-specific domain-containing protein n=1 Tax=Rhodoferax sediminis TaxID=2509614 RepID=UPI001FCEF941|nr:group II intron maturase-specific domain-containing protein [Rhodoferax sediminis]